MVQATSFVMSRKLLFLFCLLCLTIVTKGQDRSKDEITTESVINLKKECNVLLKSDLDSCLFLSQQFLEDALILGNKSLLDEAFDIRIRSLSLTMHWDSVIHVAELWNKFSLEHKLDSSTIESYLQLGEGYYGLGQNEKGIEYRLKALQLAKEKNISEELVEIYLLLGLEFFVINPEKGVRYSKKAIHLADSIGLKRPLSEAYTLLAYSYNQSGKNDSARIIADQNLKLSNERGYYNEICQMSTLIADIYRLEELHDSALVYYDICIETAAENDLRRILIASQAKKGYSLLSLKRPKEALNSCHKAFEMGGETNDFFAKTFCCKCLNKAYQQIGDYEKAYYYLDILHQEQEEKLNSNFQSTITQKEEEYYAKEEALKAENILNLEKARSETLEIRNKYVLIAGLIIATLVAIFIGFIINRNKLIRKQKALIDSEYEHLKEFTENASHEMQTPMAIMQSKLENLMKFQELSESQLKEVSSVYSASQRMSQMNQSLLLLFRIENGQFDLDKELNITESVERYLDWFSEIVANKNLRLEKSLIEDVKVKSHNLILDRIISNLLKNAVTHNISGGNINVELTHQKLVISNTGQKLETDPDKLFERFFKNKASSSGTGLGLAIVKRACDAHGWEISYNTIEHEHTITITF